MAPKLAKTLQSVAYTLSGRMRPLRVYATLCRVLASFGAMV